MLSPENGRLRIRLARTKREMDAIFEIRRIVFLVEQHVPKAEEWDGLDDKSKHIIVTYSGKPVACARIRFLGNKAKLERIAVLKPYRKMGVGRSLVGYMVSYSRRRKAAQAVMNAQVHAKGFYQLCGFRPFGKTFMEAGIPHVKMHMKLRY